MTPFATIFTKNKRVGEAKSQHRQNQSKRAVLQHEFAVDSGISANTIECAKTDKNQQYAITKTDYFTIFQHITKRTTNNANTKNNKEQQRVKTA